MSKSLNQRGLIGIGLCGIVFFIGYYILNYISTMEDPPLGNTIYILIGSLLVLVLGVFLILKYIYDSKKKKERRQRRRKNHKLFYLKDSAKNKNS
jgi:quinol-cytochrome oxidoreductase complex cytochrome b subunit